MDNTSTFFPNKQIGFETAIDRLQQTVEFIWTWNQAETAIELYVATIDPDLLIGRLNLNLQSTNSEITLQVDGTKVPIFQLYSVFRCPRVLFNSKQLPRYTRPSQAPNAYLPCLSLHCIRVLMLGYTHR